MIVCWKFERLDEKKGFLTKYKLSKLTREVDSEQFNNCTEIDNADKDFTGEHYQTFTRPNFYAF